MLEDDLIVFQIGRRRAHVAMGPLAAVALYKRRMQLRDVLSPC
jgi:hypothetical protein